MDTIIKPSAYFPMSDDDDDGGGNNGNEPYSNEYHEAKRARLQQTSGKTSLLDAALHDDVAVDFSDYLDRKPKLNEITSDAGGISDSGRPTTAEPLKIVSVRSLADATTTMDSTSNSAMSSLTNGGGGDSNHIAEENLRDHLRDATTKTFGIAKVSPVFMMNRSKPIGMARRNTTAAKSKPMMDEHETLTNNNDKKKSESKSAKSSKLKSIRRSFDKAFKGRKMDLADEVNELKRSSRTRRKSVRYGHESNSEGEENNDDDDDLDEQTDRAVVTKDLPSTSSPIASTSSSAPSSASANRSSRRKTAHIMVANDEIEFVTDEPPVELVVNKSKKAANAKKSSQVENVADLPILKSAAVDKTPGPDKNPNEELIKKVAFLRCCVNYMMTELGRQPYSFHRLVNVNCKYLRSRYQHNKIT